MIIYIYVHIYVCPKTIGSPTGRLLERENGFRVRFSGGPCQESKRKPKNTEKAAQATCFPPDGRSGKPIFYPVLHFKGSQVLTESFQTLQVQKNLLNLF